MTLRVPRPIEVPWEMKGVDTADLAVEELDDGRLRFSILHGVIEGVTPTMIVWFLKNMDGVIEVGGRTVPRYRAWHPRDHVAVAYVRRSRDGSNMGPGSRVRIQELFGADPANAVDVVEDVERLDEGGFVHGSRRAGHEVVRMEYTFDLTARGTLYRNSLTVGAPAGPLRAPLNHWILPRLFPREKGIAWQKHNVEEVGNWQFFLPRLYRDAVG